MSLVMGRLTPTIATSWPIRVVLREVYNLELSTEY